MLQKRVIAEYQDELVRSRQPGYQTRYDDGYGDEDADPYEVLPDLAERPGGVRHAHRAAADHAAAAASARSPAAGLAAQAAEARRLRSRHLRRLNPEDELWNT